MPTFSELAQSYTDGVFALIMPMSAQASHVSQRGVTVMSYSTVAAQARQLLPLSAQLARAGADKLASAHPQARVEVQLQLLAKALTDLAISQQLLDAADDEKLGIMPQVAGASRSASLFEVDTYLRVLVNGFQRGISARNVARSQPAATIQIARLSLNDSVGSALNIVLDQTAAQGQAAFKGLVGIGLYNLSKAASIVGTDIAKLLGYGAEMSELYRLVNEYVGKAHETILTLLGRELSSVAVEKALDFFNALKDGGLLIDLLEKLFETQQTRAAVSQTIESSGADVVAYNRTLEELDTLTEQFRSIMDFVSKLLIGLKFVGMIPAAAMPQAQLVMSASHAVLFTYIVLAGADFADSPRIKMLNRVPGIRDLVTANLVSQG